VIRNKISAGLSTSKEGDPEGELALRFDGLNQTRNPVQAKRTYADQRISA
jgi:hypothetical protein